MSKKNKKKENIIEISELTKTYPGDVEAVKNISFEVKRGEIFAFLGPNGAGKSTTISMLTTLLEKTNGKAFINGYEISDKYNVRQQFGVVFQDESLDRDLTAYENLYFHANLYGVKKSKEKQRIEEMLKFVDLREVKDRAIKHFSGGMKRRLEVARGLLHFPKILFLDEPTTGLDPQSRMHIWDYLTKVNKEEGLTVFLTSHYMDEVEKVADRIAIIDHGEIQVLGTLDELRKATWKESLDDIFVAYTWYALRED